MEAFAQVFYRPPDQQNPSYHAHMQRHLQPAVDRFRGLPDDEQRSEFRTRLSAYVKLYAFLSQILPYTDRGHDLLYSFGRFLLPHLPLSTDTEPVNLTDEVALQYYRLERIHSGAIDQPGGQPSTVRSPTEVGTGKAADERVPLSKVIEILNPRFAPSFTDEDRLSFQQIKEKAWRDEQIVQIARANPYERFALGIRHLIERLMIQRMTDNDAIVTRYMEDREFQWAAFPVLAREIFDEVMEAGTGDG